MKIRFEKSFERDLRKIKDKSILLKIRNIIETLENAKEIGEFKGKLGTIELVWKLRKTP